MNGLRSARRWFLAGLLCAVQGTAWAQVIRLPGGFSITDPRRSTRLPTPQFRSERPEPNHGCSTTIDWIDVLHKEYPDVDLARTSASRMAQMVVPLFTDDVFAREFGNSYSGLSDVERREFAQTHLNPCLNVRQYGPQMSVLQHFRAAFMPGNANTSALSPGQLIPAVERLTTARATLQADEQSLAAMRPSAESYDRAAALSTQRKDELARVWPSERERFIRLIDDAQARSGPMAVEEKIQPLLTFPASAEAARQLGNASQTYRTVLASMPPDQAARLKAKLEERRSTMLRELLPAEQMRAVAFPPTQKGLVDGAEWFQGFQGAFLQPPVLAEADAVAQAYLVRRKAALEGLASVFRQRIEATNDGDTLATLYDDVFRLREDRQSTTWQELSASRAARAKVLTERADAARRAAEEWEERAALARGEVVLSSLKLANVQNANLFRALYTGDAASAGLSRTNILFAKMFETYLIDFGRACRKTLPPNAVQMTYEKCTTELQTTVVSGYYVNTSTSCVHWDTFNYEGAFAEPRAYRAQQGAQKMAEVSFAQNYMKQMLTNPMSIFGTLGDAMMSKETLEQDLPQLIEQNGCGSKALVRLQENMTRLALDQDPLHLPGYVPDQVHTTIASDLNVRSLADDLIRADSTNWALNRYRGLNGAGVVGDLDSVGRPRRVHATFSQEGFGQEGSVDIAFTDGTPTCLYFADAPTSCKTPSSSVIKRFRDGQYRRSASRS